MAATKVNLDVVHVICVQSISFLNPEENLIL